MYDTTLEIFEFSAIALNSAEETVARSALQDEEPKGKETLFSI